MAIPCICIDSIPSCYYQPKVLFEKSGIEKSSHSVNRDKVRITVSLRAEKENDAKERNKYNLTPGASLRITENHVKNTIKDFEKHSLKVFSPPNCPKKITCNTNYQKGTTAKPGSRLAHLTNGAASNKRVTRAEISARLTAIANKGKAEPEATNTSTFDRMLRLGVALDNRTAKVGTNGEDDAFSQFDQELNYMRMKLFDTLKQHEKKVAVKATTLKLENGWVGNTGDKKNIFNPITHSFVKPKKSKLGKADGLMTLEQLISSQTKNVELTSGNIPKKKCNSNRNNCKIHSILKTRKGSSNIEIAANDFIDYFNGNKHLNGLADLKLHISQKVPQWYEKAQKWLESCQWDVKGEEKLTKAWRYSFANWKSEERVWLMNAERNLRALENGSFLEGEIRQKSNEKNYFEKNYKSVRERQQNRNPRPMKKREIMKFCLHWDKDLKYSPENNRKVLMTKFLELYSGLENELDIDVTLNGGGHLLFMRFCFGFKVAFIKKFRCWKYLECVSVFIQSANTMLYTESLIKTSLLEDVLDLVCSEDGDKFDKLHGLHFFNTLIEGPKNDVIISRISSNGKLKEFLANCPINCGESQIVISCRNILLKIIEKTNMNIAEIIIESILGYSIRQHTPFNISVMFQVVKSAILLYPSLDEKCVSVVLSNLNTTDTLKLLVVGDLAINILDYISANVSTSIIKTIFNIALGKLFEESSTHGNAEQISALFVINYILDKRPWFLQRLIDCGVLGLSLAAISQPHHPQIQNEGIRLMAILNLISFPCAATYTLILSDKILSDILRERVERLTNAATEVFLCLRKLAVLMFENWDLWLTEVINPTKQSLLNDSKENASSVEASDMYASDCPSTPNPGERDPENNKEILDISKTPIGKLAREILSQLKTSWAIPLNSEKISPLSAGDSKELDDDYFEDGSEFSGATNSSSDSY